ncbi:type VII secretion protein EssB/YukC [Clostridium sporogenes]|uniref:type VII secretion protein EssB/YukC n=1 Tax=Clostridium sporogenes TaxID=1509 RepID=UPI003F9110C2
MENTINVTVKKSNLNSNSEFDFYQIAQKSENLLDCNIHREEDQIQFQFFVGEEKRFDEIRNFSIAYRYQSLINVIYLLEVAKKVDFSMSPMNLYFDINMMPKIMMRDVYRDDKYNEEKIVKEYKSLIGYTLQNKYSFEDYFNGGEKLLLKSKVTRPYASLNTVKDLCHTLIAEFKKYQEELRKTKIEVNKNKFRNLKYFSRIGSIVVLILAILCGYYTFFIIPENKAVIKGNESYVKQDYISVIESLKDIKLDRLSTNSKYIYALSYIKTDALSEEQKNNIFASVTLTSNEKILNYWIDLSRSEYDAAIDIAKQLRNKEYLLYGYMKQKAYIEGNNSLSGQAREEQLKKVEQNIKELSNKNSTEPSDKASKQKDVKKGE